MSDDDIMIIPPPAYPIKVASFFYRGFQEDGYPTLVYWRGDFMFYSFGHWDKISDRGMRNMLYFWTSRAYYGSRDDPKSWNPNTRRISDVVDALISVAAIPDYIEPDTDFGASEVTNVTVTSALQQGRKDIGTLQREVTVTSVTCVQDYQRFDLDTGLLRDASPRWFNHSVLPIEFDPDAKCPRWLDFLATVWPDDQESIDLLQEWAGYLISGETRAQKMMVMIGPKRAGKGTISRVLEHLVGEQYCASPTLSAMCENFGLQSLIGKKFAVVGDARLRAGAKDTALAVTRLLMISGEDRIDIDRKHRDPWTGKLLVRFMILSNETPRLTDASAVIASRFLFLQMTRSFAGMEDVNLLDQLLEELPGIFNWAVEGYQNLKQDNFHFTAPDSADEICEEMESLASPIKVFLEDCCDVAPYHSIFTDEIFKCWQAWCESTGNHVGSINVFGRDLRAATEGKIGIRTGTNPATGKRAKMMSGIRICPNPNIPAEILWQFIRS